MDNLNELSEARVEEEPVHNKLVDSPKKNETVYTPEMIFREILVELKLLNSKLDKIIRRGGKSANE